MVSSGREATGKAGTGNEMGMEFAQKDAWAKTTRDLQLSCSRVEPGTTIGTHHSKCCSCYYERSTECPPPRDGVRIG